MDLKRGHQSPKQTTPWMPSHIYPNIVARAEPRSSAMPRRAGLVLAIFGVTLPVLSVSGLPGLQKPRKGPDGIPGLVRPAVTAARSVVCALLGADVALPAGTIVVAPCAAGSAVNELKSAWTT